MKTVETSAALDHLVARLGDCLTPESARRVVALRADRELQARVEKLASRHREGKLSQEETAEYGSYVSFSTFIAILKSKARRLLSESER